MSEQSRKKIALLVRALLIAARMFADAGYDADGSREPEKIAAWIERKAREELRVESGYRMSEAIKKHPRA
jgi:hypothetical protein